MPRKEIAAFLAATMMVSQAGVLAQEVKPAVAGEEMIVQPRYIALDRTNISFSISSGTASCYGITTVGSGYKAKTIVELQKKNISWSTTKTWTKTGTSTTAIVDEDYSVTSGTYRIKVTHQALSGTTIIEEKVTYSGEVTR